MRYALVHNNTYWTGDRFSDHVGEALLMSYARASSTMKWLTSRFHIQTHIREHVGTFVEETDE